VWTKHTSYGTGTAVISNANRARAGTAGAVTLYYASGIPGVADYDAEAFMRYKTANTEFTGVCGRIDTAANTFYIARWTSDELQLRKFVAGVDTSLGASAQSLTADQDFTLKLQMRGTSIKLFFNDVERISVTDSAIAAAGRAGLRWQGISSASDIHGLHFDTFTAVDTVPGGGIAQVVWPWFRHRSRR
jgi:hypothetical protein